MLHYRNSRNHLNGNRKSKQRQVLRRKPALRKRSDWLLKKKREKKRLGHGRRRRIRRKRSS